MKRISILLMALVMVFGLTVQAHAILTTIGTATYNSTDYNLISDNDLGIVWLDYSNNPDLWLNQVSWAAGLNTAGVLTYNLDPGVTVNWTNDWRLPTTLQPDPSCGKQFDPGGGFPLQGYGYGCTGSEMGHLYYTELGNSAGGPLTNTGDFNNLQAATYWSGTEYAPDTRRAWGFVFNDGVQDAAGKVNGNFYALAVRPGNVSTSVPEPATLLLLGSGLAGMAVLRKRLGRREV